MSPRHEWNLCMAAKEEPNVVLCMPNRTNCILLVWGIFDTCACMAGVVGAKSMGDEEPLVPLTYSAYPAVVAPQPTQRTSSSYSAQPSPFGDYYGAPALQQQQQVPSASAYQPQQQQPGTSYPQSYPGGAQTPSYIDCAPQQSYAAAHYHTLPYSTQVRRVDLNVCFWCESPPCDKTARGLECGGRSQTARFLVAAGLDWEALRIHDMLCFARKRCFVRSVKINGNPEWRSLGAPVCDVQAWLVLHSISSDRGIESVRFQSKHGPF
jgi:hypothetical protein